VVAASFTAVIRTTVAIFSIVAAVTRAVIVVAPTAIVVMVSVAVVPTSTMATVAAWWWVAWLSLVVKGGNRVVLGPRMNCLTLHFSAAEFTGSSGDLLMGGHVSNCCPQIRLYDVCMENAETRISNKIFDKLPCVGWRQVLDEEARNSRASRWKRPARSLLMEVRWFVIVIPA
jgi:hypothetical protein